MRLSDTAKPVAVSEWEAVFVIRFFSAFYVLRRVKIFAGQRCGGLG